MNRRLISLVLVMSCAISASAQQLTLPLRASSVRFAVIGDTGTGDKAQYETGQQLNLSHQSFPFEFVIMLGDNIYGSERPQDFEKKFVRPYKPLLDAKLPFYATLGNHDDPNQRFYKPFNMNGERYYTFKKGNVRFFVLDSNYMDPPQVQWLVKELQSSGSDWKIPYFHHPLYSSGMHGSAIELRNILEPVFLQYGVDAVFSGHEHFYERIKPQKGIAYFTSGGAAKLRDDDIRTTALTAQGFDTDRSFMLVEIAGDQLFYQTISRTGKTVDQGSVLRREVALRVTGDAAPGPPSASAPKPAPKATTGRVGR